MAEEVHLGMRVSIAVLFLVCIFDGCLCSPEEDRLLKELLRTYQKYGRPGPVDEAVNVTYGLKLMAIEDFCTKTDSITVEVWENYQWTDDRLKWDSEEYGGLKSIRLSRNEIWTPDITPYNGWSVRNDWTRIVVYSNGLCSWVPRHFLKFRCDRNDTDVSCKLKMGSWTYDGSKLNLYEGNDVIDTTDYATSEQFELKGTRVIRSVNTYECCPEPYIDITCMIDLGLKKPLPSSGVTVKSFGIWGSLFSGVLTSWLLHMYCRSF